VTFRLAEPVALSDLPKLVFFQEKIYGNGGFGASVILGVDADGDNTYEAKDVAWHLGASTHDPAMLGGDTFVEMDAVDPATIKVNAKAVPQWWTPNAAGNGLGDCYATLADLLAGCSNSRIEATDKVHVVRLILGGSSSWNDIAVRVSAPGLAGLVGAVNAGVAR
jgi:hypothetical protein